MGLNFLRYQVIRTETQAGHTQLFSVNIGDIRLEREFQKVNAHLTPVSAMRIAGSRTNQIRLNDDIFRFNNPNTFESHVQVIGDDDSPVSKPVTRPQTVSISAGSAAPVFTQTASRFELAKSKYADTFAAYADIEWQRLKFARGSRKISFVTYDGMRKIIAAFQPQTDVFSVVGCSQGEDSNDGGLELAARRANRVQRALVRSGIPKAKILSETCWDNNYWDKTQPKRSVILTHKRLRQ